MKNKSIIPNIIGMIIISILLIFGASRCSGPAPQATAPDASKDSSAAQTVPETDAGTLRDCFFVNQVRPGRTLACPPAGDVLVDGRWLFEIGGRKKSFGQNLYNDFQNLKDEMSDEESNGYGY